MKKILSTLKILSALLVLAIITPSCAVKKVNKKTITWQYEVEDIGRVAKDGKSIIFKIWSLDKNEKEAIAQAKQNAIHAVIFKQIANYPPLANSPSLAYEKAAFFDDFFAEGGAYSSFVTLSNNGAIQPGDKQRIKTGWKIGIRVTVNRAGLRKYLEEKGVIQAMNSIF